MIRNYHYCYFGKPLLLRVNGNAYGRLTHGGDTPRVRADLSDSGMQDLRGLASIASDLSAECQRRPE